MAQRLTILYAQEKGGTRKNRAQSASPAAVMHFREKSREIAKKRGLRHHFATLSMHIRVRSKTAR
jgi:hypothetical protein